MSSDSYATEVSRYKTRCDALLAHGNRGATRRTRAITPVGVHRFIDVTMCDQSRNDARAEERERKRTRHTRDRGARIHSCVEHYVFCTHVGDGETHDSLLEQERARRDLRLRNLSRRPAERCARCEHPANCALYACTRWGAAARAWLDSKSLVPIAVERRIACEQLNVETQIDMLCVPRDEPDALVVVSLKTLGKGERPPAQSLDTARAIDTTVSAFPAEPVADCERTRHQLQLMVECVILAHVYNCVPRAAHVLYVCDVDKKKSRRPSATSSSSPLLPLVYEESADEWWFDPLFESPSALANRTALVHSWVYTHLS